MKKSDMNKMFKKYQPLVKKTGEQLSKAVKAAEKDISKMYKIAQTHVEMQMKNLQKEKLYYDLGKVVAGKLMKGEIEVAGLEKYKKSLNKLDSEGAKMKRELSRVGSSKTEKKKTSKKK
ncbi:MAG: hypothetical protein WBD24_02185 [Candidatus Omnitrophota bacterium]